MLPVGGDRGGAVVRVELVYARGCPQVPAARAVVRRCLGRLGLQVAVEETEGNLPSPSVFVDGVDVMGQPATSSASCRLDVPTEDRILAVLRERVHRRGDPARESEGTPDARPTRTR